MKPMILLLGVALALSACEQEKREDLKSPCVSTDAAPCERRAPANNA